MPVCLSNSAVELGEETLVWYEQLAGTVTRTILASKTKWQRLLSWSSGGRCQFFLHWKVLMLGSLQPCKSSQGSSLYANKMSALPKVEKGLSQLILERKTCYGHRDCTGHWNRHCYHDRPSFFSIFSDSNRVSNTRNAFQGSEELQSLKWRSSKQSLVFLSGSENLVA